MPPHDMPFPSAAVSHLFCITCGVHGLDDGARHGEFDALALAVAEAAEKAQTCPTDAGQPEPHGG
jgi:hypothetical protein